MHLAVAGATGTVGAHAVEAAQRRGHDVVCLSRSHGTDLFTGDGLADALTGVDVIVDVAQAPSLEEGQAADFFRTVAANLHHVGAQAGVQHLVTLSIVGIDQSEFGYYKAKKAHEQAAADGTVPSTIQRATQFHEFPAQMLAMSRSGDTASVPDVRVRTIAARTLADILVDVAEQRPGGRASDLAGPQEANLVDLARAFVAKRGQDLKVVADTETMASVPDGGLLPGPGARIEGPTFEQWLDSDAAAALPL